MRFWKLIIAGLAAGVFAFTGITAASAAPVKLRIAWIVPAGDAPLALFKVPGIARHEGKSYTLDFVHMTSTPAMITALAAGEIDLVPFAYSSFALAVENARLTDLRIIADVFQDGVDDHYTTQFMVLKDSPIKTIADLKGKVVTSNGAGSAVDIALRAMLKKHGMVAGRDYTLIESAFPNMKAELLSHKVDLITGVQPFSEDPQLRAAARTLFTQKQAIGVSQMIVMCAREAFIKKNRAALVDFLEDNLRELHWYHEAAHHAGAIKTVADCKIGDTITDDKRPTAEPLPGFKPAQPVVFCGLFPVDAADFEALRAAMGRLRLNDASFQFEPETSAALGFGFRCGFLGLLHLEIIRERLVREFDLDLIATAPSVIYRVALRTGKEVEVHNPVDMPDPTVIERIDEPWIEATIMVPDGYLGQVLKLCEEKRGEQVNLTYTGNRVMVVYHLPLNEVVFDFYDRLKSASRGYASFDYHVIEYRPGDLVKLTIMVNGEPVDALAAIVHRGRVEQRGRQLCERLKDLIPRQLFRIAIQAAIGGRVIARETVSAMRKDVLAKCYGGDVSRKRKLLEKQKAGKKRMRQVGNVDIPQEAFLAALKMGEE